LKVHGNCRIQLYLLSCL